jgi:hypothetical protein
VGKCGVKASLNKYLKIALRNPEEKERIFERRSLEGELFLLREIGAGNEICRDVLGGNI